MAYIGNIKTANPSVIKSNISPEFMKLIKNEFAATKVKFDLNSYTTKHDGELEQINDMDGNKYGYDHASLTYWGFTQGFGNNGYSDKVSLRA